MPIDPQTARLRAQVAAHARWAKETDRTAATAAAREAAERRWDRQVDPDGKLDPAERAKRAESALKAEMARLNLRRRMARRKAEGA
ncbi:hypothetical protein [Blastococcus tunisiensis]|uniref:Uncharacterized protein n=1 Tax=Blastococcus tunisiensis TaxID=1798228 RepID=A0A1I2G2E7_9ACTN|nr:hypothetical protein [Blastococcus sp. DSM 46838]SFF11884.1 hypothetical protein SAMN05216574_10916 [Blastococcus sp. DSM 46838]